MARKTSAEVPKLGKNIQGLSAKTICSSKVCGGSRHSPRTIKEPTELLSFLFIAVGGVQHRMLSNHE